MSHIRWITSSCASFLIRKGRFLAVVMRMSAACSVERKGRIRATILFPFLMHMICTKWSSLGLQGKKNANLGQQEQCKKSLFSSYMLLSEYTAFIFTLQLSVLQNTITSPTLNQIIKSNSLGLPWWRSG